MLTIKTTFIQLFFSDATELWQFDVCETVFEEVLVLKELAVDKTQAYPVGKPPGYSTKFCISVNTIPKAKRVAR